LLIVYFLPFFSINRRLAKPVGAPAFRPVKLRAIKERGFSPGKSPG